MNSFHSVNRKELLSIKKRILIVRDPLDRLFSGYINRVVRTCAHPSKLHDEIEEYCCKPILYITFLDFVFKYVGFLNDSLIDGHFRSQSSFLTDVNYSHIWNIKNLYSETRKEFGEKISARYFKKQVNATEFSNISNRSCAKSPLVELHHEFIQMKTIPEKKVFFTDDIVELLYDRYRLDYALLNAGQAKARSWSRWWKKISFQF